MSARTRGLAPAWLALAVVACGTPAAAPSLPPLPEASAVSLEGVDGPLAGTLDGSPFEVRDARFRVVSYPGRERVDLVFATHGIERCGLPIARAETRFWLRVPGVTALAPGELALLEDGDATDEAPLEVHYERPDGRRFVESHRGIVRLEITRATTERVVGRLHACFGDASRSCVAGAFDATPCRSRIDGRALREPPGLTDEALEPLPRGTERTELPP